MHAERWKRVEALYQAAMAVPVEKRAGLLNEACSDDPQLRSEVQSLLDQPTGGFLESSPLSPSFGRGASLGSFEVLERIGRGGMGEVWRARDSRLNRDVALKILPPEFAGDPERRSRLLREARVASALNHPNIVSIYEVGSDNGVDFIAMELVEGESLAKIIPAKGMPLAEALNYAVQIAGALAKAHAAGVIHRDLKPGNIMLSSDGLVKLLDFGLARRVELAPGHDPTVTMEGQILGTPSYMSPEQVEGKIVDAQSDIFSFGAVLYEMITGQRAFQGESRASTLAAIMEKDPQQPSEISPSTPIELDRIIARCLRKDVSRRSQNIADVKLALEELRDESDSGTLARPKAAADGIRRWIWPAAVFCALIVAAAFTWTYLDLRGTPSKGPDLVQVSPDDGHAYSQPAISPDGGFVAFVSDRSGNNELWLQQVGGGDPIRLTHSSESVSSPAFLPDGKRIIYVAASMGGEKNTIDVISALGGEPRVLAQVGQRGMVLSPDGSQIAYLEDYQDDVRLMTVSSDGGQPRELLAWGRMPRKWTNPPAWTSDSRYLLCVAYKEGFATNGYQKEWYAFPVDGGVPVATGVGGVLREAGLVGGAPILMTGDRVLFWAGTNVRRNAWEVRLSPGSWHVKGIPHQLTFGTLTELPNSISATGTVALEVGHQSTDFYLIPLSAATGQPTGAVRRLTQDGRYKFLSGWDERGDPGSAYFNVAVGSRQNAENQYALDLDSGKQTLVAAWPIFSNPGHRISPDGRLVAYSVPEGDSYSIRVGDAGAGPAQAPVLCKACGWALGFSPDGRFLLYNPERRVKDDPKRKLTVRLLEVASGKDRPWLEHPTDSLLGGGIFGRDSGWLHLRLRPPGSLGSRHYLVPWREKPVPQSEWVEIPGFGPTSARQWDASPRGNFYYFYEGSKLMTVRFDSQRKAFNAPQEVKFVPGSEAVLKPDDNWEVRGPGLVLSREETASSSVCVMKLPR